MFENWTRMRVKPTSWVGMAAVRWPSKLESISRNCQTGAVLLVMIPYSPP